MSKKQKKQKKSYAAPTLLAPFSGEDAELVQVVIETPKGSRNKYSFDKKLGAMKLTKTLPAGMAFPYDFGFIPSTRADDEDPIDVLLLMDEPAFPGCVIDARIIGVIEGEQTEDGKTVRNDRLVAVASGNHIYSELNELSELNSKLCKELERFFTNYHMLDGAKFKVIATKDRARAMKLIKKSLKRAA
jgi:inorganic pyrophosphatase